MGIRAGRVHPPKDPTRIPPHTHTPYTLSHTPYMVTDSQTHLPLPYTSHTPTPHSHTHIHTHTHTPLTPHMHLVTHTLYTVTDSNTHPSHTHTPPPPYTLLPSAPGQGWEAEIQKARPRTSPLPRLQEWPTGRTGTQKSENISHLGAGGDQPSFPEPSFPEPPPAFPRERRGSREIKASFPEGVGFSWAKRAWADWNGDSDTR